jgi:hypothetical protein
VTEYLLLNLTFFLIIPMRMEVNYDNKETETVTTTSEKTPATVVEAGKIVYTSAEF